MQPSTPYLRIDLKKAKRNITGLAEYGREHGIGLRPHTKTHKSLLFAGLQLQAGAVGLTVAKPGEAEVMAAMGSDLLVAYPVVDPNGCRRIAELARDSTLRVAVDTVAAARGLGAAAVTAGSTLGVLIDLDVGMHRTGVQTPAAALALAQVVAGIPGLRIDGLFSYPGQVWAKREAQAEPLGQVADLLQQAIQLFSASGFSTGIVSGGSTPTAYQSALIPQLTEIRSGTYIFNDMNTVHGGYRTLDDCAATIVCTVVSDAVPGQVIVDAGSKTLTMDRCFPAPDSGHGTIVEYPEARISALSEEHGQVDITRCASAPRVGDRVTVIPNHICPCVNLQDQMWLDAGGELEPILVDARGKVF